MLVLTIKDGACFYVGDVKIRVFVEECYVDGKLERVVEFEVGELITKKPQLSGL